MKTIATIIGILLLLTLIVFLIVLYVVSTSPSAKINKAIGIEEHKKNLECLTLENYLLIRESPYADELSEYTIYREEYEIKFRGEAAFFTLTTFPPESSIVKLSDFSTHGLREKEFVKYVCNLVDKIIEKNNQIKNKNNH